MILMVEALSIKVEQGFDPTLDKRTYELTLLGYKKYPEHKSIS